MHIILQQITFSGLPSLGGPQAPLKDTCPQLLPEVLSYVCLCLGMVGAPGGVPGSPGYLVLLRVGY